jgi:hypothetical protein
MAASASITAAKKLYWEEKNKIANELFNSISKQYPKDVDTIFNLMYAVYENTYKKVSHSNWKTAL